MSGARFSQDQVVTCELACVVCVREGTPMRVQFVQRVSCSRRARVPSAPPSPLIRSLGVVMLN